MIENDVRGVIINLSSIGSKRVVRHYSAYSCSKAAMDMMTKTMALELGPSKVRYYGSIFRISAVKLHQATAFILRSA